MPVQWEYMWDLWWTELHWQHGISTAQFSPCVLVLFFSIGSCDGVVNVVTRLWEGRSGVWIQTAAGDYSLQNFRSYCWSYPAFCTMGRGRCLPWGNAALDFYHLLLSSAWVKNALIYSSTGTCAWKFWSPTLTHSFFCYLALQFHKDVIRIVAATKNFTESTKFL